MCASGLDNRLIYSAKHTKGKDFSRLTKQFYGFFYHGHLFSSWFWYCDRQQHVGLGCIGSDVCAMFYMSVMSLSG